MYLPSNGIGTARTTASQMSPACAKKAFLPIATEEFLHSSAFIFEKSQRFIDRLFASRQNGDQLDTVFVRQQIWNVRLSGENAGTDERHPDTRVGHSGTRMDSLRRSF